MDKTKFTWTEKGKEVSRVITTSSAYEYSYAVGIVTKRRDKETTIKSEGV